MSLFLKPFFCYNKNFNPLYERIVDDSFFFGYKVAKRSFIRNNWKDVAPGYNPTDAFTSKNYKPLKSKNSLYKNFKGKIIFYHLTNNHLDNDPALFHKALWYQSYKIFYRHRNDQIVIKPHN